MSKTILITGAAGFIGRAACRHFLASGWHVVALDSMVRPDSHWPYSEGRVWSGEVETYERDVRDLAHIPLPRADVVLHLAAQVSVTRSYSAPRADLEANVLGTFEAIAFAARHKSLFIYASTNKVFGELVGASTPILDSQALDPRTPYGVTKAAGALLARELLGDRAVIFHQSCIYGPDQCGSVDQGWVAFLHHQIRSERPITCFGDGTQVRDLLHVHDLIEAYAMAVDGRIQPGEYVIGGGVANSLSFAQVVDALGGKISGYADWRPKDQRYFVSANEGVTRCGWSPSRLALPSIRDMRAVRAKADAGFGTP